MGRHEVFEYVKTFTEVRLDWQLDCTTCCICHQTTHTSKLFDLFVRTTGTGVSHHKDVVVLIQSVKQSFCKRIIGILPCLNNFFVTFFFCDKTTFEVLCDSVHSILCFLNHLRFLRRHCHLRNRYCHRSSCRIFVSCRFDLIQHFCCHSCSMCINNFFKNLFVLFFTYKEINFQ